MGFESDRDGFFEQKIHMGYGVEKYHAIIYVIEIPSKWLIHYLIYSRIHFCTCIILLTFQVLVEWV